MKRINKMNTIYSIKLEYISESDDPEKELLYAIESVSEEDMIIKYFGYLINTHINNKFTMLLIVNSVVYEIDVTINGQTVTILKGPYNDIKMYIIARIAQILDILTYRVDYKYFENRIISLLDVKSTNYVDDTVKNEIIHMDSNMQFYQGGRLHGVTEYFRSFQSNLKRFVNDESMKTIMSELTGFSYRLIRFIVNVKYDTFYSHVSRLYLICDILEYSKLNQYLKTTCRMILLDYHHIDYDDYPEILREIAEWMYVKYFNDPYFGEDIEMDKVD